MALPHPDSWTEEEIAQRAAHWESEHARNRPFDEAMNDTAVGQALRLAAKARMKRKEQGHANAEE